jgi:glycosyltransferase involved in cell wall biosynthesis
MKKKHLAFCGYNVFPLGFAQTQRLLLTAKGLNEKKCNITVLCRYGTYAEQKPNIDPIGQYEGINYIYCSGLSYRPNAFILRNFRKMFGLFFEFYLLVKYRISGDLSYIYISTNEFRNILYYSFVSKILFVPSVIDNTEFWSASKKKNYGIGAKMYDALSPLLFNKVICISDFLYNHSIKIKKVSNVLKIPAIVDFSKFNLSQAKIPSIEKRILFCGSATYYEIIDFTISAFELSNVNSVKLIIVSSNGRETDFKKLNERIIKSSKANSIELKSNLIFSDLINLYINSSALLIPMRPSIQDIARFPHKLGEYTASKSIIITTNNGEIPNYFEDLKNALVTKEFNLLQFAAKIEYAINNYNMLNDLKEASYQTGLKYFDYKLNGERIYNFLFRTNH